MPPLTTPAAERALAAFVAALALLAVLAPVTHLPVGYHDFADQRAWLGLPNAMDVLTNAPFALLGAWGLAWLRRVPAHALAPTSRVLAVLFLAGLVSAALASGVYHLHPHDGSLCLDRLGMAPAFAGLLGLAVAERVGARAGVALAVLVALAAPATALIDALTGNMTPWSVLQGGGLVLLLALCGRAPRAGALGFSITGVLAAYSVAKALELADAPVFAALHGVLSGHSAKHVAAALAALPLIVALRRRALAAPCSAPAAAPPRPTRAPRRLGAALSGKLR